FTCDQTVAPDRIFLSKSVGVNGSCGSSFIGVMAGTEVTYCYAVTNQGGTTLTNHTLIDNKLGTLLNDATFSLAPGMTHTFSTTAPINVDTPSMATWHASVGTGAIISDSAEAYVSVSSVTETDIRVKNDVSVESVIAGDEFTFYIAYSNLSTVTASDVWISSTLPAELSYVSSPPGFTIGTQTPTLQNTGNVVSWHMPELPAFASGVLYLTVRLSDTALVEDIIESDVTITTMTTDSNLANNSHQRSVNVAASFQDLEVEKRGPYRPTVPGGTQHYVIYYRNIGNRTVENVILTDTLPADVSYKTHQSTPFLGTMEQVDDDVIFSIGSLAPNQNGFIQLTVDVPDSVAITTVLTNTVSITGDGSDADTSNNSDIVTSTVTLPGRITGTITSSDGSPLEGAIAGVAISNQWFSGVTDANGHYVIENLPEGTYLIEFWMLGRKKVYSNVTVTSGETTPNINAQAFPPLPPKAMLLTGGNRVWVDPATGEWNIRVAGGSNISDLTFSMEITCDNGALPTNVALIFETESNGTFEYLMTADGATYTGTVPRADFALGTFKVAYDCGSKRVEEVIGHGLIDPSGFITDSVTGDPIVGATVTLYTIDGWVPKTGLSDTRFNTCHTLDTRPSVWNDMAPALQIGRMGNPLANPQEIHPLQNPLFTDDTGYYAWDVAIGCWYIVVEADGYETRISPAVGVPPEVTDLHLTMNPIAGPPASTSIFLPFVTSSP
ncbi:MAG: carboxypeptidase regulatory-like domain-containing protein, partial [Pseudomonadota bacterium]